MLLSVVRIFLVMISYVASASSISSARDEKTGARICSIQLSEGGKDYCLWWYTAAKFARFCVGIHSLIWLYRLPSPLRSLVLLRPLRYIYMSFHGNEEQTMLNLTAVLKKIGKWSSTGEYNTQGYQPGSPYLFNNAFYAVKKKANNWKMAPRRLVITRRCSTYNLIR